MPYQIKNGIVYGSGAVSLTQAQYDALSTAEKNNGTVYYIYDSDAVMDAGDVGIDGGGTLQDLVGSIATIETSPATAAHAVGSYILWNGQLYEVTSAIAVGETLTVGSNITATTITTGLTEILNGETVTIIPASGYSVTRNYSRKLGNILLLCATLKKSNGSISSGSWNTMGRIDGLTLADSITLPVAASGTNANARGEVNASGNISMIFASSADGGTIVGILPME